MITSKNFLRIICLFLFITNIYIIIKATEKSNLKRKEAIQQKQYKQLEILHANCTIPEVLEYEAKNLFNQINGLEIKQLDNKINEWCKKNNFPKNAIKIIAYNVNINNNIPIKHTPINVSDNELELWERLMDSIDTMHRLDYNHIDQEIINKLKLILPYKLIKQPNKFKQINVTTFNTYAIWFNASKNVEPNKINSVIIFFHDIYIKNRMDFIVKSYLTHNYINTDYFGYYNSDTPEIHFLPDGLSANLINDELLSRNIKMGFTDIDKMNLFAYAKPNGNVFIAIKYKPFSSIPIWSLSLFFLWMPIWYKYYLKAEGNFKLSLKMLSIIMLILVLIQPMGLIINYCEKMIISKINTIKQEKISKMLSNLTQLDLKEPEILKINKEILDNIINIVQYSETNPLGVDNKEKFQQFIDETVKLELNTIIEQTYIIDENGKLARVNPLSGSFHRLLATMPKYYKDEILEESFNGEWSPPKDEYEFIVNHNGSITIEEFMNLRPQELINSYIDMVTVISKELINIYNTKHNKIRKESVKDTVTSGIFASVMGGKGEEYITSLYNRLGYFFEAGYDIEIAIPYINVLKNKNNEAKYAVMLSSGKNIILKSHLERIFRDQDKWPKNMEYLAVTKTRWCLNFPYLDLWKRLKTLLNIVKPPLIQYSTEIQINGEPNILCAYKANKTSFYTLFAIMPLWVIDKEINVFEIKMLVLGLLVLLIIGYILIKIYNSVFIPTKALITGVEAISQKKHDYKVVVETNDEWEKLAEAFNMSLETLKELEVASFLQNTILPSGIVKNENISFYGQSVSLDGIGGDYFDVFIPQKNQMMFLFGDVSGHSVSAALVVSMAHSGFASLFDSGIREPSELLKSFSNLMLNNLKRVKMMTCFSGFIDEEGNMKCSNAGQTFPLIVDKQGNITKISVIGYPMGSAKRAKFKQETIKLPDRCRIILYSDGIIEAMNEENEPFGYNRLEQIVREMSCKCTIEEFKSRIYKELKNFTGSVPWSDDCSVAIVDYIKPELYS